MNCPNCNADLAEGVFFCSKCGQKIVKQKRFCRECGTELNSDAQFCRNCGAKVNNSTGPYSTVQHTASHRTVIINSSNSNNYAYNKENTSSRLSTDSIFQDDQFKKNLRRVLSLVGIFLVVILAMSAIVKYAKDKHESEIAIPMISSIARDGGYTYEIDTDYTYAYMSSESSLYVAVPISSSVIKIEYWDKNLTIQTKPSFDREVGTYRIDDEKNGFFWIDDEHTAFAFNLSDKNNSYIKNGESVVFTINLSDSDEYKGTDYDKSIGCYSYTHDEVYEYRAIPLTDKIIKIEVWRRPLTISDPIYVYDLMYIFPDRNETDFEWADSSHTAFTITMIDPNNDYYWKERTFVSFTLCNEKYRYKSVAEYLGINS